MKNLMDIILDGEQIFEYRLKFAFEPQPQQVKRIEQLMAKYDLMESSPLSHTIFQTNPHDFPNLDAGEIWMMDVTLGRALQHDIATQQISETISAPIGLIRVRGMSDPIQDYLAEAEGDIEFDEEYTPKLTDTNYSDATEINAKDFMGDELSDKVATDARKGNAYSAYMIAGYEQMYPTATSDIANDQGPIKE